MARRTPGVASDIYMGWPAIGTPVIHNLAAGERGFTSNTFLVEGARTALVDAGNDFDLVGTLREREAVPDLVALTHTHPDHVGNLDAVREAFDLEVAAPDPETVDADRALADGDRIDLGDHTYEVIHTPGHKDAHVCLYAADDGVLFAGDLVFANGAFGRTDLEEGDRATLVHSIQHLLERVGDVDVLYAGHGPTVDGDARGNVELALEAARR